MSTENHVKFSLSTRTRRYLQTEIVNENIIQKLKEKYQDDRYIWPLVVKYYYEGVNPLYIEDIIKMLGKMRYDSSEAKLYALQTLLGIGDPDYIRETSNRRLIHVFELDRFSYSPFVEVIFE